MAKNNNRIKKQTENVVQAVEGNTGTLTVALLNQILEQLKVLNERLK